MNENQESPSPVVADIDEENTTKLLRQALFSNPSGAIKGFFKDVKEYYRTIFKQFRHPAFSVKEGVGDYSGDVALVKTSVSIYITFVLIGMAITELSGKATMGNMAVAAMNFVGILVFFATIWCAIWVGRMWIKWAKPEQTRRQLDQIFVYESCLVFSMVIPILLTDAKIVIWVCWLIGCFHPFYMFFRIHKVAPTSFFLRIFVGAMLMTGFSISFCFQLGIGMVTAADQDEIAAEGTKTEQVGTPKPDGNKNPKPDGNKNPKPSGGKDPAPPEEGNTAENVTTPSDTKEPPVNVGKVLKPDDVEAIPEMAKQLREKMEQRDDGVFYIKGTDTPYEGAFAWYRPNGTKAGEMEFKDGKLVKGSERWWNSKGERITNRPSKRKTNDFQKK